MFVELKKNKTNSDKPYRIGKNHRHLEFTAEDMKTMDDAGYLIPEDEIIIDIDNHGSADDIGLKKLEFILKTFEIKTKTVYTNSGVHLYFKKPKHIKYRAKSICNLGFPVEYKQDWVITKVNGVARKVVNEDKLQTVPLIFEPNTRLPSLVDCADGDNRHNNMVLLWCSVVNEQVCRFVNNHIFAEPIPNDKLNNIFNLSPTTEKSMRELALDFLKEKKVVKYMYNLYCSSGSTWVCDEDEVKGIISEQYADLRMMSINEIYSFLKILTKNETQEKYTKVKFANGFVDKGRFVNLNYKEFTPFSIKREYKPEAKPNQALIDLFDLLFQKDLDSQLYFFELIGSGLCLDFNQRLKDTVLHIFYGGGGDGKTLLFDLLRESIGNELISATKLHDIARYKDLASMSGKLYNFGEDIDDKPVEQSVMSLLKNVSSLNMININEVHKNAKSVRITAQMLFTSNNLIKTFEKGVAVERRFKFVNFTTKLKKLVDDGTITDDFFTQIRQTENIDYIIKLIVEGYERWYANGLRHCSKIEEFSADWLKENDFTKTYILENGVEEFKNQSRKDVYINYLNFCDKEDYKPRSKKRFTKQIETLLNLKIKQVKFRSDGVLTTKEVYVE